MSRRSRQYAILIAVLIGTACASPAQGQTNTQVWGDLTLSWIKSHAWTLGMEVEPKAVVSKSPDTPGWATLDATPSAEYAHGRWFDGVGELHVGRTHETDHFDSTEVTPRIGLRFHVLSNLVNDLQKERQPRRRFVLQNLARVEWRNLYYSANMPSSSTVRYRDRVETDFPLNRGRMTDAGALYASSDVEWFWTRHDPPERFASKQRIRAGLGYRWSFGWRAELLYVWDRTRDSAEARFTRADSALDIRVRRVW
jgi:hypothetical protein